MTLTPRPVAVEIGRDGKRRTVYRVFAYAGGGLGGWGCWLTAGRWWWRNDKGGRMPGLATFKTEDRARDAIRRVPWPVAADGAYRGPMASGMFD